MALTTMAGVNTALAGAQRLTWQKSTPSIFGYIWSSWLTAGNLAAGVTPSSGLAGDVPTKATAGAFPFVNSANSYLGRIDANLRADLLSSVCVMVYDRLWHNSGIDATSTGAQTISANDAAAVHLTRPDALGASVEAWWEVYATMGAGTPTVTLAYTDQGGNVETTGSSGALVTTMATGRTGQFQLAAGDTGVRSIQTWTSSATFTSGTIDLVLRRQIAFQPVAWRDSPSFDAVSLGLPRIYDDACLEILIVMLASATTVTGSIDLYLVQG